MLAASDILIDVALKRKDHHAVVVLKNLPETIPEDTVVNWVEVVCGEEILGDSCYYHKPVSSAAVAVLSTSVEGNIIDINEKSKKKRLAGQVVEVSPIGCPDGILIVESQGHSQDSLELYFESPKSGGQEDIIKSCMVHEEIGVVVLEFSPAVLPSAVECILKKGNHVLNAKALKVLPYYAVFHDYVIDQIKNLPLRDKMEPDEGHVYDSLEERHDFSASSRDEDKDNTTIINLPLEEEDGYTSMRNIQRGQSTYASIGTNNQNSSNQSSNSSAKGNILFITEDSNSEMPQRVFPKSQEEKKLEDFNYTSSSPFKEESVDDSPKGDRPSKGQKHPDNTYHHPKHGREKRLDAHHEMTLARYKLVMLRICSFQRQFGANQVKIDLERNMVTVKGQTDEEVQNIRKAMVKKLESVQEYDCKISEEAAELLEEKIRASPDFIRKTLMEDKVYAHVTCSAVDQNMHGYAFQRTEAQKAVEKILSLIKEKNIPYTEHHFKYLGSPAWQDLVKKFEIDNPVRVKVLKQDKTIRVVSLFNADVVIKEINQTLEKFKGLTIVTAKPFIVRGGKGKLMHYCLQKEMQKIQSDSRQKEGQVEMKFENNEYVISIRGNEKVISHAEKEIQDVIRTIWEGPVDLRQIATRRQGKHPSDGDVGVLMKGLSSRKGKDFLKRFSVENSCVVLVNAVLKSPNFLRNDSPRPKHLPRSTSTPDLWAHTPNKPKTRPFAIYNDDKHPYMDMRRPQVQENSGIHGYRQMPKESPKHEYIYRRPSSSSDVLELDQVPRWPEAQTKVDQPGKRQYKSIKVMNSKITCKRGSITAEKATILVNVLGDSRDMTRSVISKSFLKKGGPQLQKYFRACDEGQNVIVTESAGDLLCQYVAHMVLHGWSQQTQRQAENEMRSSLRDVFTYASSLGAESIAFPLVGAGRLLGYRVRDVVEYLVSEAVRACNNSSSCLNHITFVIFEEDPLEHFINRLEEEEKGTGRPKSVQAPVFHSGAVVKQKPSPEKISAQRFSEAATMPKATAVPSGTMTMFCGLKERGERLRSTLSNQLRENFLFVEKIKEPKVKKLGGEQKRKINRLCLGKPVQVKIDTEKEKIRVCGEKDAVSSVCKDTYKILLEVDSVAAPKSSKYVPPKSKRGTKQFWIDISADPPAPFYWKHFRNGFGLVDHIRNVFSFHRVEQHEVDQPTFNAIKQLVEATFDRTLVGQGKDAQGLGHKSLQVTKVERIENFSLYKLYAEKRIELFKLLGHGKIECKPLESVKVCAKGAISTAKKVDQSILTDMYSEVNEHYFFHGTEEKNAKVIAENGLDPRYGSDKGMFGQGTYGAECSTKADQYADSVGNRQLRNRKMLLIRLLLGEMYVANTPHKYSLPPCKTCQTEKCVDHKYVYNSVVGEGKWLFREFVVYDRSQCYPEYVITYNRL